MDQLLAIRTFARVVEAGNFTRAAASLRMPKATVSKLVQRLEAHLGVQLLQRTTRKVAVTAEGASYYERSTAPVRALEDLDASFSRAAPRGHLRVDLGSSVASSLLIPALPAFTARYPEIRIDLSASDRDVDLIADNVDCVIRGGARADSALVARTLGRAAMVTCATPAYLATHGTPRRPRDLAGHRIVNYVSARSGRILPMQFLPPVEVTGASAIGVNESNGHFAAGLAGLGVMQTFGFLAQPAIDRGALVPILARYQPRPYPFQLAYPANRHLHNRLRVFIDWAAEVFSGLLGR